jgi:2-methylisocitrate lyase-like PEP mutase family enzyme
VSSERPSVADKRRSFRRLHESGCFVLPNPWDLGSARYLQQLGFQALGSTSAGFAWTQAAADGAVGLKGVLAHLQALVAATDLPVNADFQNGFASEPAGVAENVRAAVATGIAGLSIEDATGDAAQPLYPLPSAIERVRAARGAIDASGGEVLLVGRAECFLVGRPDLEETITRLRAYADAGADCLYAPGLRTSDQIAQVVKAVAPTPVNVLWSTASELAVDQFAALGVRRVSLGGALARVAWGAFARTARTIAEQGCLSGLAQALTTPELDRLFKTAPVSREAGG